MKHILLLDVFSHAHMHLPFNEAYLEVLTRNFPDHNITFVADKEHVGNLKVKAYPEKHVTLRSCKRISELAVGSLYNPWVGYKATTEIWNIVLQNLNEQTKAIVFCGFDANILRMLDRHKAVLKNKIIHLVLHNDLSANFDWRSKNPVIRYFDLISALKRGLSENIKIVALELGIGEAIEKQFPKLKGQTVTLEHPIIRSEASEKVYDMAPMKMKVGFVGHCSKNKGFDTFLALAEENQNKQIEFHAIGMMEKGQDESRLTSLKLKPSRFSVPREEYISALKKMDVICLPISKGYQFVASGSVIDAITSLKPMYLVSNSCYEEMKRTYGDFGVLYETKDLLHNNFLNDCQAFFQSHSVWVKSLRKMREMRFPENIKYDF